MEEEIMYEAGAAEEAQREYEAYADYQADIQRLVSDVGEVIDKHPEMKGLNFGLFYQHGRIGYVDLDAFARSTKIKLTEDGEEQTLTELKQNIDKED